MSACPGEDIFTQRTDSHADLFQKHTHTQKLCFTSYVGIP